MDRIAPEELLEHAPIGMYCLAADGTILWANAAEYEPLGYEHDAFVGQKLHLFCEEPHTCDELLRRTLAGETVYDLPARLRCADGEVRPVAITASAHFDEHDVPVYTRCFTHDPSARRERRSGEHQRIAPPGDDAQLRFERDQARTELSSLKRDARERLTLLIRASDALAQSLDYERTLKTIAELPLPTLGDFVLFDLHEGDALRRIAHADDHPAAELLLGRAGWPACERPELGLCALPSGQSTLHDSVDDALLSTLAESDEQLAALRELSIGSVLSVPLSYQGTALGALTLFFGWSGRRHSEADLELAEELARRAASAIVNARLLKEARDAIGTRDDFLSMAGHELRTPLTALQLQILSITKMLGHPSDTEKIMARAEKASRNVLRLSSLVNELLDISRISAGRLRLERGPMDLGETIGEVLQAHAEALTRSGCDVNFSAEPGTRGYWDRVRVEQITTSLLNNAMTYGKGKPIDVEIARQDGMARLVVRDHGIGISAEDQQRIFQRFERAVSSRHFGGLGLGLWIARQLVDAHGGTIRVTSEQGLGATFEVALPITEGERQP